MNADSWREVLEGLIERTRSKQARWRRSDDTGRYVLAHPNGSIAVSMPNFRAMSTLLSADVDVSVLDPTGEEVDRLPGASLPAGFSREMARVRPAGEPSGAEATQLQGLAVELFTAILEQRRDGERIARSIINDI